ncbi:MAG: hypothetical protein VYD19_06930, partial [Myxococcota bacterium]|nr:hypothetical protein [Myxococcota bacterium]
MSLRTLLILLIISLYGSSHALGAPEEARTLRLSTDRSTLPRLRVRVQNDPFYQRGEMVAEGIQLRALLEARFGAEILRKQSQYLIRFVCSDGYETIYPLSESVGSNGVVADRFIAWG